jgi:hypothetical protein
VTCRPLYPGVPDCCRRRRIAPQACSSAHACAHAHSAKNRTSLSAYSRPLTRNIRRQALGHTTELFRTVLEPECRCRAGVMTNATCCRTLTVIVPAARTSLPAKDLKNEKNSMLQEGTGFWGFQNAHITPASLCRVLSAAQENGRGCMLCKALRCSAAFAHALKHIVCTCACELDETRGRLCAGLGTHAVKQHHWCSPVQVHAH